MNAAKGMLAAVVWISWLIGAAYMQYRAGWWALAIYVVGSMEYAVWSRLLERSME